jgi:superfamily II DNA or RNA helicase
MAKAKKLTGRSKVAHVMREYYKGKLKSSSGQKVTSPAQAKAIAMSEAGLSKNMKIKEREGAPKSIPKEYENVESNQFADVTNKFYPLDNEKHVRAALSYFGMPRNYQKYDKSERKIIAKKIFNAASKYKINVFEDWLNRFGLSQKMQKARPTKYVRKWRGADGKWRYLYKNDLFNPFKALINLFSFKKEKIKNQYKKMEIEKKYNIDEKTFASHLLEYLSNKAKWDNLFEIKKEGGGKVSLKKESIPKTESKKKEKFLEKKISFNKNLMKDIYNLFHKEQKNEQRGSIIVGSNLDRESLGTGKIKTAREDITRKPSKNFLSQDLRRTLRPHQQDFVNLAVENFLDKKEKAVFNMDGTGSGKTLQELGLAQTYLEKKPNKPILIVTENKRIVDSSFIPDAELINATVAPVQSGAEIKDNSIYITTYNRLKEFKNNNFGLVLFDESHNLKNKSKKTEYGEEIINKSDNIGLFSATPLDKGNQIGYIAKAFNLSKTKLMKALGYALEDQWTGRDTIKVWKAQVSPEEIANRIDAFFTSMTEKGLAIKREVPLENLSSQITNIELTESQKERYNNAEKNFFRTIDRDPKSKATALMTLRRVTEELKMEHTVNNIEKDFKENKNKQIVLFATRVNDSETFGEESLGTLKEISKKLNEKGIDHVNVFASNKKAKEDIQKFQDGETRVILTTPQSGGTGLSLDDTSGDRPRKAIVMTPPFSAMDFIQMAGRINRLNTKSPAEVEMYTTNTMVDGWNKDIIANKLLTLGAAVSGDYKKIDIKELEKLQFMSNEDQRQYMEKKNAEDQKVPYLENRNINFDDFKVGQESKETSKFPKYPLRNISSYETFIPKDGSKKWPDAKIAFGKYNGTTLSELQKRDPGYMQWMLGNISTKYSNMVGNIDFIEESPLQKAKKVPVGTISGQYKKVSEGKWVKVTDKKNMSQKTNIPKLELEKEYNSMWQKNQYYIKWNNNKIKIKSDPNGKIKKLSTLSDIMELENIPKNITIKDAIQKYPIIKQSEKIINSIINTQNKEEEERIKTKNKITENKKWNEKIYGGEGNYSIYLDGEKKEITNEEAKQLVSFKQKTSLKKATDLFIQELKKAKALPVGTVSGQYKKVGEGKWVKVTDKKEKKNNIEEKKDSKDIETKSSPVKEKMRSILKKFAGILADALSGKDVVDPSARSVEEVGEDIKRKSLIKKQQKKEKTK